MKKMNNGLTNLSISEGYQAAKKNIEEGAKGLEQILNNFSNDNLIELLCFNDGRDSNLLELAIHWQRFSSTKFLIHKLLLLQKDHLSHYKKIFNIIVSAFEKTINHLNLHNSLNVIKAITSVFKRQLIRATIFDLIHPIILAVTANKYTVVEYLLQEGFSVNEMERGKTPLSIAASLRFNSFKMVTLLISSGALLSADVCQIAQNSQNGSQRKLSYFAKQGEEFWIIGEKQKALTMGFLNQTNSVKSKVSNAQRSSNQKIEVPAQNRLPSASKQLGKRKRKNSGNSSKSEYNSQKTNPFTGTPISSGRFISPIEKKSNSSLSKSPDEDGISKILNKIRPEVRPFDLSIDDASSYTVQPDQGPQTPTLNKHFECKLPSLFYNQAHTSSNEAPDSDSYFDTTEAPASPNRSIFLNFISTEPETLRQTLTYDQLITEISNCQTDTFDLSQFDVTHISQSQWNTIKDFLSKCEHSVRYLEFGNSAEEQELIQLHELQNYIKKLDFDVGCFLNL